MNRADLERTISDQVWSLKSMRAGGSIALPHAKQAYVISLGLWKQVATPANELLWRRASLCYGATLSFEGKWAEAADVFDTNPTNRPAGCADYPIGDTPKTIWLATHMLMGEAVARWRYRAGSLMGTHVAIKLARDNAVRFGPPEEFGRFYGVILTLSSLSGLNQGYPQKAKVYATEALRFVSPSLQPELRRLALYLAGQGDGLMPRRGLRRHRATLQATECLYLFQP